MKLRIFTAALAALAITSAVFGADAPKREFRSSWVAGMGIDWPPSKGTSSSVINSAKSRITTYLDNFRKQNFTGICFHVRPNGDAYYKSTLEPWSADISGTRGKDPGWDPLAFVVEECHKRGLECYAWINPFRISSKATTTSLTTSFDKQWDSNGWTIFSSDGTWKAFDPANEGAMRHCLDVIKEIYTNYAIDGMLFDDYFYPGPGMAENSTADDYSEYKASGTKLSIADWRRENVNNFVKTLQEEIQASRPDLRFGIGPAGVSGANAAAYGVPQSYKGSDWQYSKIYADPLAWMNDKSIDFIAPQIYWSTEHSTAPYEPICRWWSDMAEHFGIHNYVSIASYRLNPSDGSTFGGNNETGWSQIGKQVDLTRSLDKVGAPGVIYYNTKCINGPQFSGLGDYLLQNKYTAPSLVPPVDWKGAVAYGAPSGLSCSGSTLSWSATAGRKSNSIIRYTVYAVPGSVLVSDAMAADGDGLDGKYLLGVTYGTSYTIPSAKMSGYWYAVCVYDGYGLESSPATIGIATEKSTATTLVSPADGARAEWTTNFAWRSVASATYRLQLATDAAFSNLVLDRPNLTATSESVDFAGVSSASSYYWRVVTTQSGKMPAESDSRMILAPQKTDAPTPELTAPEAGAIVKEDNVTFKWTCAEATGLDGFRVEIITDGGSFASPVKTVEVGASVRQAQVSTSVLGVGSYKWRVTAYGSILNSATSAVSNFSVTEVANPEPGYEQVTDGWSYSAYGDITIKNDWIRSSRDRWGNMTFDSDGLFNRGMAANSDEVFISGRTANAASSELYLDVYSALTGAKLRRLVLRGAAQLMYGCNDVIHDSKGHILIYNMSLASTYGRQNPVNIYQVNTRTGALTLVAEIEPGNLGRMDHVNVLGDVTTGNFTVMCAVARAAKIAVWKVKDGVVGNVTTKTVSEFHPSDATDFGIAPRIIPVSETRAYIDGGNTSWALYDFASTPKALGYFADNNSADYVPASVDENGGAAFTLGDREYLVYNWDASKNGCQFRVVSHPANCTASNTFSDVQDLWTLPRGNIGSTVSSTASAPCNAVVLNPGKARVFIYSPGNGLAAYTIVDASEDTGIDTGVDAIESEPLNFTVAGLTVALSETADAITAYTLTGVPAAQVLKSATLTLPAPGTYILRVGARTAKIIAR